MESRPVAPLPPVSRGEGSEADWNAAPVLTGTRVRLEPLRLSHAEGLLAAADDDAVFAYLRDERPRTPAGAEQMITTMLAMRDAGKRVPWVQVSLGPDGSERIAGTTSYWLPDPEFRAVEIGFTWIGRAWWRTGLNAESKLLLLRRAFDDLGAVRVTWQTDVRNERSQAAIAGLGATREGVLRKNRMRKDGTWRDSVLYAMTDDDWPAVRDRLTSRLTAACPLV